MKIFKKEEISLKEELSHPWIICVTHVQKILLTNNQISTILPQISPTHKKRNFSKYNWTFLDSCFIPINFLAGTWQEYYTFSFFDSGEPLRAVIILTFHSCYTFFMLIGKICWGGCGPWATTGNNRQQQEHWGNRWSLYKVVYPIGTAKLAYTILYDTMSGLNTFLFITTCIVT